MLDRERLILAIDIQRRSYKLLQWIGTAIDKELIPISQAQHRSDTPDTTIDWIAENFLLFPRELQPDRAHIREFASLMEKLPDLPSLLYGAKSRGTARARQLNDSNCIVKTSRSRRTC